MVDKLFDSFGADKPYDPMEINGDPDEFQQSSLRNMIDKIIYLTSTNYEYLPIFIQSAIMSLIQDLFMTDPDFRYDPIDTAASRVLITKDWNRNLIEQRDRRPMFIVAFNSAQGQHFSMRDMQHRTGVNEVRKEKGAILDTSAFQVTVLDENPTRGVVLAQRVRAKLVANRMNIQAWFNLHDVTLPSLTGATGVEEYDDVFQSVVSFQVTAVPKWTHEDDPEFIRKILFRLQANAGALIQDIVIDGTR